MHPEDLDDSTDIPRSGERPEAGEAVEALLEEVNEETQPQPAGHLAGLRGRTAVVSGGASGIGREIAIEFARCGTNVAFNWYDIPGRAIAEEAARTEAELQQLEVRVLSSRVDVRDGESVREFIRRVGETLGDIHFLINAAGVHRSGAIWNMSERDWREVLDVNLTGAFNMVRAVAPLFRSRRHGKIVNVSSVQAYSAGFGVTNYAASKSGLLGFTRSLAADLGPSKVNVNAVAPGFVRTGMVADIPEEVLEDAQERAALQRLPTAAEVAHVVVFLCSEMARGITGQVIRVDAGLPG